MAAHAPQQKLQIHIKRIRHSGLIKLNITNIHRNREGTVQSVQGETKHAVQQTFGLVSVPTTPPPTDLMP